MKRLAEPTLNKRLWNKGNDMEFDLYENESKIFLRVWPEYGSSGIWVIDEPMQQKAGKNISYEALNLPQDLANDFAIWQDKFDEHGIEWNTEHEENSFYQDGLELAKKLKEFFKYRAYVEYEGHIKTEIKYYYVMAEYTNVALWDDEGSAIDVALICEELSIYLETHEKLEKEFYEWSGLLDKNLNGTLDLKKFNETGYMLSKKFEKLLPDNCRVGYINT